MTQKKTSVVMIDDQQLLADGVELIINMTKDMKFVGNALTPADGLKLIEKSKPDVALVDLSFPNTQCTGLQLLKEVRRLHPKVRTIALSVHQESMCAKVALKHGAVGYVEKAQSNKVLYEAIRMVMRGEVYVSADATADLLKQMAGISTPTHPFAKLEDLTGRELEIFELYGGQCTRQEIAKIIGRSAGTVDSHRKRIMKKLGLKNMSMLAEFATKWHQGRDRL